MSRQPMKKPLVRLKTSVDRPENTMTMTPENDKRMPMSLFGDSCSWRTTAESRAMKMTLVLMSTAAVGALVEEMPTNWKRYSKVTPVSPNTRSQGSSFFGTRKGFFMIPTRRSNSGVATRKRRNPRSTGSISRVACSTTMKEPAQTNAIRTRRTGRRRVVMCIGKHLSCS